MSGRRTLDEVELPGIPRRAERADLGELMRLEAICFEPWRQDSRRVIRASLTNPRHEVWVVPDGRGPGLAAALYLRLRSPDRLWIYSIGTDPRFQGSGLGRALMRFARVRAVSLGLGRMTLEADVTKPGLAAWYERIGFQRVGRLPDFYAPGRDAWEMIAASEESPASVDRAN